MSAEGSGTSVKAASAGGDRTGCATKLVVREISYAVRVRDGTLLPVIGSLSLTLRAGQILGIVGPNGCGKSTLFRLLLGQATVTAGRIETPDGAPSIRGIFQNVGENLVPWKTVAQNVGLPALRGGTKEDEDSERVREALSQLGITALATRFPSELSGGQQQMAILARWIAFPPDVLLVDEAWANLDVTQRPIFRDALIRLASEKQCGIAVVSHDLPELVELADAILVLTPRPAKRAAWVECSDATKFESARKQLWDAVAANFNHSSLA